jgi:hypothetical protein
MSNEVLPMIQKSEIDTLGNDPADYIYSFVEKYHQIIASDPSGQIQNQFTTEQNVLIAFDVLDIQISNGGFIQLIENSYGPYIFDTPLSDHLRDWGAAQIATIIDQARIIYQDKKTILERPKTLEEFVKLYKDHPDFEVLENQYYSIIDSERAVIKNYIVQHIDSFARIVG